MNARALALLLLFVAILISSKVFATVYENYDVYVQVNVQSPSQTIRVVVEVIKPNVDLDPNHDSLLWYADVVINGVRYNEAVAGGDEAINKRYFNFTFTPGQSYTPKVVDYSQVSFYIEANWNRWGQNTNPLALQHYYVHLIPSYYVSVVSSYGKASGSGYYKAGSEVTPSLDTNEVLFNNGTKLILAGWKVNDGISSYNINIGSSFTVRQATTAEAIWEVYYKVLVFDSFGGKVKEEWVKSGEALEIKVNDFVDYGNRTGAKFSYWKGDLSGSQNPTTITVNSPKVITAVYERAYYLKLISNYSSAIGEGWYIEGSSVSPSVKESVVQTSSDSREVFLGWNCSLPLTIVQPTTLVAVWEKQYYVDAQTKIGSVSGAGWYKENSYAEIKLSETYLSLGNSTTLSFVEWSDGEKESSRKIYVSRAVHLSAVWVSFSLSFENGMKVGEEYWFNSGEEAKVKLSARLTNGTSVSVNVVSPYGEQTTSDYFAMKDYNKRTSLNFFFESIKLSSVNLVFTSVKLSARKEGSAVEVTAQWTHDNSRIAGIKVKCLETGQEEVSNYIGEAYFNIVSNSTLTFIPNSFVNGITSFYEAEV